MESDNKKSIFTERKIILFLLSFIFVLALIIIVNMVNVIYINDNGKINVTFSTFNDHEQVLSKNNISYNDYDKITHAKPFLNVMLIDIVRGNKIRVIDSGNELLLYGVDITLSELFERHDIIIGEEDILSIDKDTVIKEDLDITIQRVSYEENSVIEPIQMGVSTSYTPLLKNQKQIVLSEGQDGAKHSVYKNKLIDGKVIETILVSSNVIKDPIDKQVLVGSSTEVISDYNFGGNLTLFKKSAVATAYSARKGALTASGRPAVVGNIAVNPNQIPYGTKLYIKASDGSFIYGYAVAADTGGFVVNGSNTDVDLFFDTYEESCLFGKKLVDIYIVN